MLTWPCILDYLIRGLHGCIQFNGIQFAKIILLFFIVSSNINKGYVFKIIILIWVLFVENTNLHSTNSKLAMIDLVLNIISDKLIMSLNDTINLTHFKKNRSYECKTKTTSYMDMWLGLFGLVSPRPTCSVHYNNDWILIKFEFEPNMNKFQARIKF